VKVYSATATEAEDRIHMLSYAERAGVENVSAQRRDVVTLSESIERHMAIAARPTDAKDTRHRKAQATFTTCRIWLSDLKTAVFHPKQRGMNSMLTGRTAHDICSQTHWKNVSAASDYLLHSATGNWCRDLGMVVCGWLNTFVLMPVLATKTHLGIPRLTVWKNMIVWARCALIELAFERKSCYDLSSLTARYCLDGSSQFGWSVGIRWFLKGRVRRD